MNALEEAISFLMANGATITNNVNYPAYDEVYSIEPQQIVGPAEYKADLAEYFDNLSINSYSIRSINDLIICTKSHPKEEFPSRNIDFWEKVAPDFNSPEITVAFKHMRFLRAEGGVDGALNAAKADVLILPSVICSDIFGLTGYRTITVPMGYPPNGTPITKNPRGDLVDEAPNVP
jgi:amidase